MTANTVIGLINAIEKVDASDDCKAKINTARTAYDSLNNNPTHSRDFRRRITIFTTFHYNYSSSSGALRILVNAINFVIKYDQTD